MGKQSFFKSPHIENPQIRKFLGSFCYLKSANFLCEPIRKLQIRKCSWLIRKSWIKMFLQNIAQLFHNSLNIVFKYDFLIFVQIWIRAINAIFVRRKHIYLRTCRFAELICGQSTFAFSYHLWMLMIWSFLDNYLYLAAVGILIFLFWMVYMTTTITRIAETRGTQF